MQALSFFHQAVEKDPDYALAYTGIGSVYVSLHNHHLCQRDKAYAESKKVLQMALRIDNQLSQAYVLKGLTEIWCERNYAEAEKSLNRAIELNPNNAEAYQWKSHVFLYMGKFDSALEMINKAMQFDPISILFNEHLIRIYYFSENYRKAILQAEEPLEFEKQNIASYVFLTLSYAELGYFRQSMENVEKAIGFRHTPECILLKAYVRALVNDKDGAKKNILYTFDKFSEKQIDLADLAYVYSAMGYVEKAFELLEKAYESNSTTLCILKYEKRCKNLRHDFRFKLLLEKVSSN